MKMQLVLAMIWLEIAHLALNNNHSLDFIYIRWYKQTYGNTKHDGCH